MIALCPADHGSLHVVLKAGHTTQFVAGLEQGIFSSPIRLLTHVDFLIIVNAKFLFVEMLLHQSFPRFYVVDYPWFNLENLVLALPEQLPQSSNHAGTCDCLMSLVHIQYFHYWCFPAMGMNIKNPEHMSSLRLTSNKY